MAGPQEEAEIGSYQPRAQRFRRRRRAFAAARLSHDAAAAFVPRPVIIAIVDCCNAAAFSVTMRRYSVGVQLPRAIIEFRRAIVSHEAAINSTIISGNGGRRRRASLFILGQLAGGQDSVKPTGVQLLGVDPGGLDRAHKDAPDAADILL